MNKKKHGKSKLKIKTGSTTMSLITASLKYHSFICKDEFPRILYFTKNQVPKVLKVNNQTEYFNSTMFIEFTIEGKNNLIDIHGNVVKPISTDKSKSIKTYRIPFVDFLKSVKAFVDGEDPVSSSVYAVKEVRTNSIYWIWRCCKNPEEVVIRTPKKAIYVNFDM